MGRRFRRSDVPVQEPIDDGSEEIEDFIINLKVDDAKRTLADYKFPPFIKIDELSINHLFQAPSALVSNQKFKVLIILDSFDTKENGSEPKTVKKAYRDLMKNNYNNFNVVKVLLKTNDEDPWNSVFEFAYLQTVLTSLSELEDIDKTGFHLVTGEECAKGASIMISFNPMYWASINIFAPKNALFFLHYAHIHLQICDVNKSETNLVNLFKEKLEKMQKKLPGYFPHTINSISMSAGNEGNDILPVLREAITHKCDNFPSCVIFTPKLVSELYTWQRNNNLVWDNMWVGIEQKYVEERMAIRVLLKGSNEIVISTLGHKKQIKMILYLNDKLVTLTKPIKIKVNNEEQYTILLTPSDRLPTETNQPNMMGEILFSHSIEVKIKARSPFSS